DDQRPVHAVGGDCFCRREIPFLERATDDFKSCCHGFDAIRNAGYRRIRLRCTAQLENNFRLYARLHRPFKALPALTVVRVTYRGVEQRRPEWRGYACALPGLAVSEPQLASYQGLPLLQPQTQDFICDA